MSHDFLWQDPIHAWESDGEIRSNGGVLLKVEGFYQDNVPMHMRPDSAGGHFIPNCIIVLYPYPQPSYGELI
jgi:hypothetical protein